MGKPERRSLRKRPKNEKRAGERPRGKWVFPELYSFVKSGRIKLWDAIYFQGIVEAGIIGKSDYKKILESGIRPESIGRLVKQVRDSKLDVRKLRDMLLDTISRRVPQEEIHRLLEMPKGRFYEQLNWLDSRYKMPLKFKHDLITKRLKQTGQIGLLNSWRDLLKSKRLLYRVITSEPVDKVELMDLKHARDMSKEMARIEKSLDGLLYKI